MKNLIIKIATLAAIMFGLGGCGQKQEVKIPTNTSSK